MAAPTVGAIGTALTFAESTTAAIDVPDGVVEDSVILVVIERNGSQEGAVYDPITSLPTGFQLVDDNPGLATIASSTFLMHDLAWKRATGTESTGGTYDFGWTTSIARWGVALRIDDCRTTGNPFEADDGAASTTTSSSSTPAVSVTTTGADRLLIWTGAAWSSSAWTLPSGFATEVTGEFDVFVVGSKEQAAAGSSGSLVGTQGDQVHAAWVGAFVAPEPLAARVVMGSSSAVQRATW